MPQKYSRPIANGRAVWLTERLWRLAEGVPVERVSIADIAELDRRWKAFEAQGSVADSEDVVRWLQTWGTPAFRNWHKR